MHEYTFDFQLIAAVTIKAESPEAARSHLQSILADCADARFSSANDIIFGEVTLADDLSLHEHLAMVDGVDCINQFGRIA